jgi:hypothetical protein
VRPRIGPALATNGVGVILGLTAVALLALSMPRATASPGASGLTGFYVDSEPGDWIGRGSLELIEPGDYDFSLFKNAYFGRPDSIGVAVVPRVVGLDDWRMYFLPPEGATLEPGKTYQTAVSADRAYMQIDAGSRGCSTHIGRFTVLELEYSADEPTSFAAAFEQHCDISLPALMGEIHVNSTGVELSALAISSDSIALQPAASPATLTVTNMGTGTQDLNVTLGGRDAEDFQITANTCSSLTPSSSCEVGVAFTPGSAGSKTARIELLDATVRGHHEVALSGSAPAAATSVYVTSSANPTPAGEPVTLTAHTDATTGTVEFADEGGGLGTANVTGDGTASLTAMLPAGSYWIRAYYLGAGSVRSESAPFLLEVDP